MGKSNRFNNQLFFEFSSQETINMLEALNLYKQLMLPDRYKPLVDIQINKIIEQLKLQEIDIYANDNQPTNIGNIVIVDDLQGETEGILLGSASNEGFMRVAIINAQNKLEIIETPKNLVKLKE